MFRCSCGRKPVVSRGYVGAFMTEDVYVLLVNCTCGSTCSAILWQCEDFVAAELEEDATKLGYERTEAPYDAAVHRGFFTTTHELASSGL